VVFFVSGVIVILYVFVTVQIVVFFVSGVIVILCVLVTVPIVVFFISGVTVILYVFVTVRITDANTYNMTITPLTKNTTIRTVWYFLSVVLLSYYMCL
jgi:hypothetical protein